MSRVPQPMTRNTMMNPAASGRPARHASMRILSLCCAVVACALALSATAHASLTLEPGSLAFDLSTTQAGAHPDVTTSFLFRTKVDNGATVADDDLKATDVDLPPGLVGTTAGVPRCRPRDLDVGRCPVDAQVGTASVVLMLFGGTTSGTVPLFNVDPANGQAAQLGFSVLGVTTLLTAKVRPSDAGLRLSVDGISTPIEILGTTVTVWGVPGSAVHDPQRGPMFMCYGPVDDPLATCFGGGASYGARPVAYMTNPTECDGRPLTARFAFRSWQQPDVDLTASDDAPPVTGCDKLHFDPSIDVTPTVTQADSASGYTVDLGVPQASDPYGLATADLRKAVVTLPAGVTLNPSVADGLKACTDAEYGFGADGDPACPDASKLGEATLSTPALNDPLTGSIYLGEPTADDPYRLFVVLQGSGVTIKLRGSVRPDPVTGQLTTTFDDNPQQPFDHFQLRFKGGARAPLTTPASCGPATTTTALTPWSSSTAATPMSVFDVSWDGDGAACPAVLPFAPGFSAGVTSPVAGAYSPFVFRVTRDDRNQTLGQIADVRMPAGLTARVAGVPLCDDAAAAAGTCGAGSQVGTAMVGSGAGTPLYLGGKVFLTKGYKGAPFGLSIVVPAIAGPFDLGDVVVRAAVFVDPHTAALRIVSDPLPRILQGIPLRLRDVVLEMDRPGFMLNPTSCAEKRIGATVTSVEGASAQVGSRFQVLGCAGLSFKPRMSLKVGRKGHTRAGASVPLSVAIRMPKGGANLAKVTVALPSSLNARLGVVARACSQAAYDAGRCTTKVGTAKAVTPVLAGPLSGSVFMVKNPARPIPDLVVALRGQLAVDLVGKISIGAGGKITARFDTIPDVPISSFGMKLVDGRNGPVGAARNLCSRKAKRQAAKLGFAGQNGRMISRSQRLKVAGCAK